VAELDFAVLAEFAKAEAGGLVVVGGGFGRVRAARLPAAQTIGVGYRVFLEPGEEAVARVSIAGPEGSFRVGVESSIAPIEEPPVEGRLAAIQAAQLTLPLPAVGLYEVVIEINDVQVKRMVFEVELSGEA
jgi:hypothetical protein